jgi:hypothetical protein
MDLDSKQFSCSSEKKCLFRQMVNTGTLLIYIVSLWVLLFEYSLLCLISLNLTFPRMYGYSSELGVGGKEA